MFQEAEEVAKANLLDIPLEFQNNIQISEFKDKNKEKKTKLSHTVTVLGYNSSKFDINLFLSHLKSPFRIKSVLGSSSQIKQLIVTKKGTKIILRFIDAMLLAGAQPLDAFVRCFGSKTDLLKGFFPYEAFNSTNYEEVLSKSEPFEQKDFYSSLKHSTISDADYKIYLSEAKSHKTRWDYLRFYNIRDVESMISPIDNIIEMNFQYKVDTLANLSLSANASSIKYALAYKDFDINGDYTQDDSEWTYELIFERFTKKWDSYRAQDKKSKRTMANPLTQDDFKVLSSMYNKQNKRCYICNARFTQFSNPPTLDRIDNSKGHTIDNVKWCCEYCITVTVTMLNQIKMRTKLD
jgi:hypothetical protein